MDILAKTIIKYILNTVLVLIQMNVLDVTTMTTMHRM